MSVPELQKRVTKWLENEDLQHVRQIYACLCHLPDSAEFLSLQEIISTFKDFLNLRDGD